MYPVNIDWWIFHFRGYEGHWSVGTLALGYYLQRNRSLACLAISRISCFLNGDAYGIPTSSFFGVVFSENSDTWMSKWNHLHQFYAYSENPLAVISQLFREYVNLSDIPLPPSLLSLQKEGIENIAQLNRFYPPVAGANYKATLEKIGLFPFPVVYPKVHPTQLYEMVLLLFVYLYLRTIEKKIWAKKNLFFIFWILYGTSRFFIEFLRGDKNFAFYTFTYAQCICLLIIMASTLLGLLLNRKIIFKSIP